MMLLPTQEELEVLKQLKECDDENERLLLLFKLKEIAIEEDKQLDGCPFVH